jgi:hypothetical protein
MRRLCRRFGRGWGLGGRLTLAFGFPPFFGLVDQSLLKLRSKEPAGTPSLLRHLEFLADEGLDAFLAG